jgi:pSer/pThr/pTyr-binding forkhead associated (FHA) protein
MIQLRILSGKMAGDTQVVRRFPFRIGRAAENDLVFDDPGVWDSHLTLQFQKKEGFLLQAASETFVTINDAPQTAARLRNGDLISFGSAKIQFWLAAPRQRGLGFRELCVWLLLIAVTAFQFGLIYHLLK